MSWREHSVCRGANHLFYGSVYRDDDAPWDADPEALAHARSLCQSCPVRRACGVEAVTREDGLSREERFGVAAGMTPQQRWSLTRRGTLRCQCGHVRDPLELIAGRLDCPACRVKLAVPPIPDTGDRWAKRHTTLARKLIAWLIENTDDRGAIPGPAKMVDPLGASIHDVIRVYDGLQADGTLRKIGHGKYVRTGVLGAAESWHCPYLETQ